MLPRRAGAFAFGHDRVQGERGSADDALRIRTFFDPNRSKLDIALNGVVRLLSGHGARRRLSRAPSRPRRRAGARKYAVTFFDTEPTSGSARTSPATASTSWPRTDCLPSRRLHVRRQYPRPLRRQPLHHRRRDREPINVGAGSSPSATTSGRRRRAAAEGHRHRPRVGGAAGAVVTGKAYPACAVIGGNPARVLREGVSWTRSHTGHEREAIRQRFGFGPAKD